VGKIVPDPFRLLWFYKFYNGLLSSLFLYAVIIAVSYGSTPDSDWRGNRLKQRA